MSNRSDLSLIAIFLLSLLILAGAGRWDAWQQSLAEKRFASDWEDEAAGLAQQFKMNCTVEAQMRSSFQKIFARLARNSQPLNKQTDGLHNTFMKHLPEGWFAADTMLYVFDFNGSEGRALSANGLSRQNGSFLARIFSSLNTWGALGGSDKKKINSRIEKLFGERTTGEMLLDNRFGKGVDVVYNGASQVLFWDFLYLDGRRQGAFLLLSRQKPMVYDAAKLALAQIASASGFDTEPVLLPVESLKSELTPLLAASSRGEKAVNNLLAMLAVKPGYDQIASFSTGTICDDSILLRSVFTRKIPYELWLVAEKTEKRAAAGFSTLALLLSAFWLAVTAARIRLARPFNFSVKARLLGLILVVGGGPFLLLVPAGISVIEHDNHAGYRAMIDNMRSEIREIDGNSTSLRIMFENTARKYMVNAAFKDALYSPGDDQQKPAFRRCFDEFAAGGVPLNAIGILNFGKAERMVLSRDFSSPGDQSRMHFFSPLLNAGLKHFSEEDYSSVKNSMNETQKIGNDTYRMVTNSEMLDGLALARQKSFLMTFGDSLNYAFYDYISEGGNITGAVFFLARASDAYVGFARNAIVRASTAHGTSDATAGRIWCLATKSEGGYSIVAPRNIASGSDNTWIFATLGRAHRNGASLVERHQNHVAVFMPCENMRGVTLGCSLSLEPLAARTARQYEIFFMVSVLLAMLLGLVAAGTASFFLVPLQIIETGISRILDRQFGFRLALDRDDELGDVAKAFDGMAQGLHERYELAQFVSGSLTSRLSEVSETQKRPEKRWGVVLASDIRSFTTLSETYPAEEIVKMLNHHLELMSSEIIANHGEIDKFIGDAVVAAFFAEDRATACANAIAAARKMMTQHRQFNTARNEAGEFAYGMGIGIACGELLIGSFGAGDRHEYSMTGHARHQAEELEAGSKKGYLTCIVVSDDIRALMPEVCCVEISGIDGLKGFEVAEI